MSGERQKRLERETRDIREAISSMVYVASGTLLTRMRKCGRAGCRCARDPSAQHGPYHEWNRMIGGKLVHAWLSEEQAELIAEAIANYREIRRLLKVWEERTAREILDREDDEIE